MVGAPIDDTMAFLDDRKQMCYVHVAAEALFEVWMADDDDRAELQWSLRCRIDLPGAVPELNYSFTPVIADGNTLVGVAGGTMRRYNLQDGSKFYMSPSVESAHYIVPYVESLVSLA
ncbi:unnamed protein product [Urochloa humidicola]